MWGSHPGLTSDTGANRLSVLAPWSVRRQRWRRSNALRPRQRLAREASAGGQRHDSGPVHGGREPLDEAMAVRHGTPAVRARGAEMTKTEATGASWFRLESAVVAICLATGLVLGVASVAGAASSRSERYARRADAICKHAEKETDRVVERRGYEGRPAVKRIVAIGRREV